MYGAAALVIEHRRWRPQFAGVCIDSVGLRPDLCQRRLCWNATTPVAAGFADAVGEYTVRAALREVNPGYRLKTGPADTAEMMLLSDPKYGLPCPRLSTGPYPAGHPSGDVVRLIDGRGLTACAAAMAAYLGFLADMGTEGALEIAEWQTTRALAELATPLDRNRAAWICIRHREDLQRLRRWLWGGSHRETEMYFREREQRVVDAAGAVSDGPRRRQRGRAAGQPRRKRSARVTCILESVEPDAADRLRSTAVPPWALYWADGVRTTSEIAGLVSTTTRRDVSDVQMAEFFGVLEQCGYVDLGWPGEPAGKRDLLAGLKRLGVRARMDLIVHCALPPFGHVVDGGETVIDALLEAVGPHGTVMLPSFNHGDAKVYNPLVTPTKDGAIADLFWRRVEAVRSENPTHALAAIGPKAERWCEGPVENGLWGEASPLVRLIREGGYILLLGVDWNEVSACHAVHALTGTCTDMFAASGQIVDREGTVCRVPSAAWPSRACPVTAVEIGRLLIRQGRVRRAKVARADACLVRGLDYWETYCRRLQHVCPTCDIQPRRPRQEGMK